MTQIRIRTGFAGAKKRKMAPDWTIGAPRGWMSSADYREARGRSPDHTAAAASTQEEREEREAKWRKEREETEAKLREERRVKRAAIDALTERRREEARVPIKEAVAAYCRQFPASNSDKWISGWIRVSSTLEVLLAPRKESNGRWTVDGSVMGEMEPWMWKYGGYESSD